MAEALFRTTGFHAALEEGVGWLRRYLRLDTTNPPGNEERAARFLEEVLGSEGVAARVEVSAPGRANLIARLPSAAPERGPLVLLHHADVVPASREAWSADPFGAEVRDGYVYGRGALDMKSVGVLHLCAFLALKRAGVEPKQDVIFLMVADEETGGRWGARWMFEREPSLREASMVLDEGGLIEEVPGDGTPRYQVAVAQKIPCQVRLEARGDAGHGSMPVPDSACDRLVRALHRVQGMQGRVRVHPVVQAHFRGLAGLAPPAKARQFEDLETSLQEAAFREEICEDPSHRSALTDSVALTMLRAGEKVNVIPGQAAAYLDCRLLPDSRPAAFIEDLARLVDDLAVTVEPVLQSEPSGVSALEGMFWDALDTCARRAGCQGVFLPLLLPGATDGRFFRRKGIPTYGFAPFRLTREEVRRIHGADERISMDNMGFGLRFFADLLLELTAC